jgi:HD superfamily phosphohydrolase
MTVSSAPPDLAERVDTFVQWLFEDYKPTLPKGPKVFNDALLGNLLFSQQEVAVIDCPVMQRLRRIKQTGLVYYVFPSATHTRFEHSLGAAALSERCFNAIRERADVEGTDRLGDPDRSRGDLAHLRMAALLHDVGHGLCSHASEQIYELLADLQEFKNNPAYVTNQPGEILSYLIVTSPTFQKWFKEYVVQGCQAKLDLKVISNLILGKHENPEKYFLAQIISSSYDCDKLDYIARDSYFCGLALTVDLPRFYSMISTARHPKDPEGRRVLVLRSYVPLEQILFSKMTLFGSVYHHQKVKCLDSMLGSMIGHIVENPEQASFPLRGSGSVSFTDAVQYLYATDDEFFWQASGFGDAYIKNMLNRFRNRDLFVRCLEISRRTVEKENWRGYGRQMLIDLRKQPERLAYVEAEILKRLPPTEHGKCNKHDVRLSIPGLPGIKTENALIQTSKDADIENIAEYFPVEQWTEAYAHNKWRSYVYAPRGIAAAVRDSAISVLRDHLKLELDSGRSNQTCHLT